MHGHLTMVAVVTGASQGTGGEVKALRKFDCRIVATARSIKPSENPSTRMSQ